MKRNIHDKAYWTSEQQAEHEQNQSEADVRCAVCKFYKRDEEYEGLGDCKNPEVRGKNARIILKYCDEFYIAEDFGCIFAEHT